MTDAPKRIWPNRLRLRDTGLYDDMGGGGQRIYTTAGRGYEKQDYLRADLIDMDVLRRVEAALGGAIADLASYVSADWPVDQREAYPSIQRRYERDMEFCVTLEGVLAALRAMMENINE